MFKRIILGVVIAGSAAVGLTTVSADHAQVGWNAPRGLAKVVYTNAFGTPFEADVLLAASYWSESPAVELTVEPMIGCASRNGAIVVCIEEDPLNSGASTAITYKSGGKQFGSVLIHYEASFNWALRNGSVAWVFCHELGHAVGLSHPSEPNDSCLSLGWRPNAHDFQELEQMYGSGESGRGNRRKR